MTLWTSSELRYTMSSCPIRTEEEPEDSVIRVFRKTARRAFVTDGNVQTSSPTNTIVVCGLTDTDLYGLSGART